MRFELESHALAATFAHYANGRRLPAELFKRPDHVALHATNIQDFDIRVKEIQTKAEEVVIREADFRFIVAARLAGPIAVADLGRVAWVEIIEPIQEESEVGLITGDHIEFFYPDFGAAKQALDNRSIDYRVDTYPQPRIKVPYGTNGDEFRLTKIPLGEIVAQDLESGGATLLKRAA